MVKKIIPIITVLAFAFYAGFALLHPGLPPTHDGEYHLIRFYEFYKVLSSGNLYPRWAPDLNFGFGVPIFNYVYPLPNYIAALFHLFGVSFLDSVKLNMFAATIVGAVTMYLWSKEFWGEKAGIISSICYTFAPYHFVDIYIRGEVGEVWAIAFFPAFLWAFTKAIKKVNKKYISLASIFLSLIIFSHNILGLGFFFFAGCYALLIISQGKNKLQTLWLTIIIFLLGLGLSAVFWIPALFEKQFVVGLQIFDIKTNFPELYQLLIPSWGSGIFEQNLADEMSVQIGLANTIIFFLSIPVFIVLQKRKDISRWTILFFVVWFVVIFYLMLYPSIFIWEHIPLLTYFQFPWRLLSLEILVCAFLAGAVVYTWRQSFIFVFFLVLIVGTTFFYAGPDHYLYRTDQYYTTRSNFIDGTNSPGNTFHTLWMQGVPAQKYKKINFVKGNGLITNESSGINNESFTIQSGQAAEIALHTAYFPGWQVFIDGKQTLLVPYQGLISCKVNKGKHKVYIAFGNTPVRTIASLVFIICFILLVGMIVSGMPV